MQLIHPAGGDLGHGGGYLAGDELDAAARRFVIEQNPAASVQTKLLPVVTREVVAGYLTDTVRGTGVEAGGFRLGDRLHLAEHFTGTGKIEPALGHQMLHGSQQMHRTVDIRVQRGKGVMKGVLNEALGSQMIAFVGLDGGDHLVEAGIAFQGGRVQGDPLENVANSSMAFGRILNGHPAHGAVDLVSFCEQKFREVGPVLTCDAGNECSLRSHG